MQNQAVTIASIREMKTDQDFADIRKACAFWEKAANGKINYFSKIKEPKKVKIAEDAQEVAHGILSILADKASFDKVDHPQYTVEKIKKGKSPPMPLLTTAGKYKAWP